LEIRGGNPNKLSAMKQRSFKVLYK
jgi:hypothetical protein